MAECESDFRITTDIPYLALTGELWGVFCEHFEENRRRYNGNAQHYVFVSSGRHPLPGPLMPWFTDAYISDTRIYNFSVGTVKEYLRLNLLYKPHQVTKLKWFSSRFIAVTPQSIEARCEVENEDVVGAAPTGDAPTTSEWSTRLFTNTVCLIFEVCQVNNNVFEIVRYQQIVLAGYSSHEMQINSSLKI